MLTTDERMNLMIKKAKNLHRKREKKFVWIFSILSLLLCVPLMQFMNMVDGFAMGGVSDLYGTTLLFGDAGGYVLVGVLAFAVAVLVTKLCIKDGDQTHVDKNETTIKDKCE